MAIVERLIIILGFTSALYGVVLLAAWTVPTLSRFRVLAPPLWVKGEATSSKYFVTVRAGYLATFGLFVGCQVVGQHLLAAIFAIPAIIFAGILAEQLFHKSEPGTDA